MSSRLVLPLILVAILIGAATKADDRDDVLAANKVFSGAFSTLKIEAMDPLWAHDDAVTIIHPSSKTVLVGWMLCERVGQRRSLATPKSASRWTVRQSAR